MKGSFKLDAKTGPVIGKTKLTVSYSAADVPGLHTPDGTASSQEQKPGSGPWTLDITETQLPLELKIER
jgi:hypothetical protein